MKRVVQPIRYLVVLVSGFIAGNRAVDAAWAWREWRSWAGPDPAGAAAYREFFIRNIVVVLLSLALAGLVWSLLRPGSSEPGRAE